MSDTTDRVPTSEGEYADQGRIEWFERQFRALRTNVESFIRGKTAAVNMALVCLMAEGHLLIEDVPGVGKTSLAKSIASSIGGSMSRVQFTPDLLPSDVTGTQIWRQDTHEFEFKPGPVFHNIVVGDEINRASPKTQSALLEVMEERQVTVDGVTYRVPRPFLVIATQNPVEYDGTYNLPEAQIDRFLMRLSLGYPGHEAEVEVVQNRVAGRATSELSVVVDTDTVAAMIAVASEVYVAPSIYSYCVTICAATRKMDELRLPISPRGSVALVTAGQAYAASRGKGFVTVDDVKDVAPYALGHRIMLESQAELAEDTPAKVLERVFGAVPVPQERIGV